MIDTEKIVKKLEKFAPPEFAEEWDNSGWQINLGKTKAKNIVPNVNPRTTYMEVALSIASTYSVLARKEALKGTSRIGDLINNLSEYQKSFPNNLLELKEGMFIIYGNNEYIAVYDGVGGCYGSTIRLGDVVHFKDCLNVDDQLMPTKIIEI